MDSIQKAYNEEYDRLNDLFRSGKISLEEFNRDVDSLSDWCSEQEGLRDQYEQWNVGKPNF